MKPRVLMWAACVALLVSGGIAAAAPATAISPLTLPMADPGGVLGAAVDGGADAAPIRIGPGRGTRFESTRYRPRRPRAYSDRGPRPESFSQLHVGFLDPRGDESNGVLFGFRGGLVVDPHVQIGGLVDWRHRSNAATAVISKGPGPGGTVITTRADLARSSSDLVPVLGFIQLSGGSGLPVIPYFGLAGGIEVLHLSADNFQTGERFEGTFSGFGWQVWGGAALPLSGRARLGAEVFVNAAELSRDVEDAFTGQSLRETVDMDGTGMRFGIQWGF